MGSPGADKDTVKNFLKTLADNNRLGILEGVCEKFGVLMSASRGEVELVVTSAQVGVPSLPPYLPHSSLPFYFIFGETKR